VTDDAGSSVTITRGEVSRRLSASEAGNAAEAGKSPPTPPAVTVDLRQLLETGDPSSNIDVYAGDRVTVQRAGVVYVLGAVNNSGGFLLTSARGDVTVLKAVALANSLKSTAKAKKALILRPNSVAPGGRDTIPINLDAMLRGRIPDRPLRSNDILFVPDSTALKALHKSADVAANTVGVAVLYR
jgi:polysaccharide export outer membrane protein